MSESPRDLVVRTLRQAVGAGVPSMELELPRSRNLSDLALDSLARLEILMTIEERVGFEVPLEPWIPACTVGDLEDVVAGMMVETDSE